MTELIINPSISLVNGIPTVTSLDVAEKFGKHHRSVLGAIRRILNDLPEEFGRHIFVQSSYTNDQGKEQPCYHLTRDGFSLLAMGFTGKKALEWKVKYIEAFNAMEAELLKTRAAALESEADRKRRLARERLRRFRERKREQLALCASPAALDEQAQKVQPLMNEVRQRGSEFMSSIFTLQSALRFRPNKMNPAVPDLSKALERTLPQFATSIGMNISALSDLLDVYSATLAATE